MSKMKRLNQSGAVSMLSVMIFAIIITVVATAYLRSVISQQKNALSYDQSTRAYYAAESGIQDALRGLKSVPTRLNADKTDCSPWNPAAAGNAPGIVGINDSYDLTYTCQLVTVNPTEISGEVQAGGNLNAMAKLELNDPPSPGASYNLVVRWSEQVPFDSTKSQIERDQSTLHPRTSALPLMSKTDRWIAGGDSNKKVHALLRVAIISHPNSGFARTAIEQQVLYLNPTTPANKTSPNRTIDANTASVATQQEQLLTNAECYRSDEVSDTTFGNYACKATLRLTSFDFTGQSIYVRVGSVYNSAKFSLELLNSSNVPIKLKNSQAIIDVTGKSGESIFRRVAQTYDLQNVYTDTQPDAALIAGEGICKLFSIGTTVASYSNGCNPLTD